MQAALGKFEDGRPIDGGAFLRIAADTRHETCTVGVGELDEIRARIRDVACPGSRDREGARRRKLAGLFELTELPDHVQ